MLRRVVLAVSEREYAAKLAGFMREEEPGWEVAAFTHESALRRELQDGPAVDLLIGEPPLLLAVEGLRRPAGKTIALVDAEGECSGSSWPEALRYQSLPALLSAIRSAAGMEAGPQAQGCRIWAVFSATGGTGKTAVALNLARQAGERGLRVFYLNLEALNATSLLFGRGEPDSLSRLLYALQAHPEQWDSLFKQICRHQPHLRADYFDAPEHPGERLAMTSERLASLLERIRGCGKYDAIVVDPDSGAGDWHLELLGLSDRVVWLCQDDAQNLKKAGLLYQNWRDRLEESPHKLLFVMNKANGAKPINRWSLPGPAPAAVLPYIPQWKAIDQPGRLLSVPAFAGAIDRLLELLAPDDGKEDRHGARRIDHRGAG
ncbi:CpaE family protein [Paenibacillaceae bacterium WGS1546]|uniref:AAA family ATPase n=1 Tax=Cohnella sp. WGS1546 TaxID=3366810 RepID=UPI00372D8048